MYLHPQLTEDVDILFLAGDVWDQLGQVPSDEVSKVLFWIVCLLSLCKRMGIIVRVLEGTPGHDMKQSRLFLTVNDMLENPVDLKHVTTLSIERIESLGLDVLYVPDRWADHSDDTYQQVTALLNKHGLDKVDIACMHGAFEYQIPKSHETHVEQRYLDIVRHYIFIGHVHIFSTYDRIISHGSFDRTGHGYETPKGFIKAKVFYDGTHTFEFIVNKGAKLYLTLDVSTQTNDEVHKHISAQTWPNDTYLALKMSAEQALSGLLKSLAVAFPQWNFKREIVGATKAARLKPEATLASGMYVSAMSIKDILLKRLPDLQPSQIKQAESFIADIL